MSNNLSFDNVRNGDVITLNRRGLGLSHLIVSVLVVQKLDDRIVNDSIDLRLVDGVWCSGMVPVTLTRIQRSK